MIEDTPAGGTSCHGSGPRVRRQAGRLPLVALAGHPNSGKTTLFNRLTGQRARVGNYPGVTVERRVGTARLPGGRRVEVLDVPGAYSLTARSPEEQVAISALLGLQGHRRPDVVVVLADATQPLRSLYLPLQLIELGLPVVVALNMVDELEAPPDVAAISEVLGVPVVAISARRREGIEALGRAIADALKHPPRGAPPIPYPEALLRDARALGEHLPPEWPGDRRALALWALNSLDERDRLRDVPDDLRRAVMELHRAAGDRDLDLEIIGSRYGYLDANRELLEARIQRRSLGERLDAILLHPAWGFAVFIGVMLLVFQSLFTWSDPAIGVIEAGVEAAMEGLRAVLPPGVLTDLVVEGVVGGVGNVVVFLPQILLLFLFIGLMEDSGYMARAAYLMDRVMAALGLHGRAFVPMLSGYACAVPAILATRTMERRRDRLLTMMVVPLMTCSARLPVYTLIIGALFPPDRLLGIVPVQGLLMAAMYVFSTVVALVAAGVLGRTVLRGDREPLLMELPPWRVPAPGNTVRMMWDRSRLFLKEAGTIILLCTVGMWALLSFPRVEIPEDAPEPVRVELRAEQLAESWGGRVGHAIEPVLAPLGFDWKIGVGLIGAFTAREVFVSTMGIVYGVGEGVDEEYATLRNRIRAEAHADGRPVYTPLVGLTLMVFFALACQCMSTLAVVRRETRSWRWPAFLFAYMTALAWIVSFAVYQGGRLLGLAG